MTHTQIMTESDKSNSYYRSHLYTSYQGINPLVTAAHPLLSLIDRIQLSRAIKTSSDFYSNLQYELNVFKNRALSEGYDEETIFISHFLLTATLNEILVNYNANDSFKQLMPPGNEAEHLNDDPNEKFFQIIDKIIDKPDHYLDLLELIYLCLSLGFEGKYKGKDNDELKSIVEKLYQTIDKHRSHHTKQLFEDVPEDEPRSSYASKWVVWTSSFIVAAAIMFCISNWYLDQTILTLPVELNDNKSE